MILNLELYQYNFITRIDAKVMEIEFPKEFK
jgi:hypothetical protein